MEQILSLCLQDKMKTDSDERVTNRAPVSAEKFCIGNIVIITAHEYFKVGGGGGV